MTRLSLSRWVRLVGWLLAPTLGGATVASPARAAPAALVNVLELGADFDDMAAAQALTNLLRLRVGDAGDFLLASDNTSFLLVAASVRCDTRGFRSPPLRPDADASIDARCLRSVGAHLGSKRYFWGHLYHGVKLHLWRDERGDAVKALPYDETTRERLVERLYLHLVRPEEAADVKVSGPADAGGELYVDGRGQGAYTSGLELTLRAGEHAFELRRENKAVARAKAAVVAGRSTEVRLETVARTDVAIERPEPPPSFVIAPPSGMWKRPAGFAALGVGAVLVGTGVFASLRVNGLQDDFDSDPALVAYRSELPGVRDVCDASDGVRSAQRVERLCSGFSTLRVAQYVFYGAGALSVGLGGYWLLTAPRSRSSVASNASPETSVTRWALLPWAERRSAGLHLGASFLARGPDHEILGTCFAPRHRWVLRGGLSLSRRALLRPRRFDVRHLVRGGGEVGAAV
jgi:hypothetical protein